MKSIASFRSMSSAVAYVLGTQADHYYTITEHAEWVADDISNMEPFTPEQLAEHGMAGITDTLAAFAMGGDEVAAVTLGNEAHLGSILAHYTRSGEIVRFVAIPK